MKWPEEGTEKNKLKSHGDGGGVCGEGTGGGGGEAASVAPVRVRRRFIIFHWYNCCQCATCR